MGIKGYKTVTGPALDEDPFDRDVKFSESGVRTRLWINVQGSVRHLSRDRTLKSETVLDFTLKPVKYGEGHGVKRTEMGVRLI